MTLDSGMFCWSQERLNLAGGEERPASVHTHSRSAQKDLPWKIHIWLLVSFGLIDSLVDPVELHFLLHR